MTPLNYIYLICDTFVKNGYLDYSNLLELGISKDLMEELIIKNILVIKDNNFIINPEIFIKYIKQTGLKENKDLLRNACLNILKYYPYEKDIIYELFMISVCSKDYIMAYNYLNELYLFSNEKELSDCNFYLFILSKLEMIPKQYNILLNFVYNMTFADMKSMDEDINNIRIQIFKGHYSYGFKLYNEYTRKYGISSCSYISKILIYQLMEYGKNFHTNFDQAILSKNYDVALKYINDMKLKHPLKFRYVCIEKLILIIKYIEINNEYPNITFVDYDGNDMYGAIKANDFKKAKELNLEYLKFKNIDANENIFNVLLEDVINSISSVDVMKLNRGLK